MRYIVDVFGDEIAVEVRQAGKTVWMAEADYQGRPLRVKGRSAAIAVREWRMVARHRAAA